MKQHKFQIGDRIYYYNLFMHNGDYKVGIVREICPDNSWYEIYFWDGVSVRLHEKEMRLCDFYERISDRTK